jgi:putative phosphoribosyl transferase
MAIFADRADAGRDLAESLRVWRASDALVVGIPRGGVVVAAAVAGALQLDLIAVVVRKLGSPGQKEYALGAIADDVRFIDDDARRRQGVSATQMDAVERAERRELIRRSKLFGGSPTDVLERSVLVVDDGVATGATASAACRSLRARGASHVVLAVPVAPATWRPRESDVDEYICAHPQSEFWSVGEFYEDFAQTSDAEVVELLSRDPRAGTVSG